MKKARDSLPKIIVRHNNICKCWYDDNGMKNAISINPLNWKRDETYAPVSKNKGDRLPVVKENEFLPSEYEPQCPGRADAKLDVETELPGIFNHPEQTSVTGRTYDETFSRNMRKMWVQFARTGNPSLSADISPDGKAYEWPLYDPENKEVMVFDEFNIHPEKESERKIVDLERTYPLTKYYNF